MNKKRKPISDVKTTKMAYTERAYKYKYNGKELQDEFGLNVYDYGARNYDAALGRWMSVDPLAEVYFDNSPYNYVANSPIIYLDPDGQRIIFGFETDENGNRIGEDGVKNNINNGLGFDNVAQIDKNGNLTLNLTKEQRTEIMQDKEKASFLGTLEEGINLTDSDGNSLDVNIDVVYGSEDVFIGSFDDSAIDIADVNAFGNNEVRNQSDVLQFEFSEQINKTKNNVNHSQVHPKAKNLLSKKKGNLRVGEPQIQRNRDGSPKLRNGRPVMKTRTSATFSDNKTGAISTIQFKTKNNNIKKIQ